jgi:branched-subunit amino acid aminotransferase/4-amino-4-deoxychorismate lyase
LGHKPSESIGFLSKVKCKIKRYMLVFFNRELISIKNLRFNQLQRGFDYGDGFFETIFIKNGRPVLLEYHLDRLKRATEILSMKLEDEDAEKIERQLSILWKEIEKPIDALAKISIWRKESSGYAPEGTEKNILVTIKRSRKYQYSKVDSFGIVKNINNCQTLSSGFKSMSAISYVIAGIEQVKEGWEEGIIIDGNGNYSEGINSNLFLLIHGKWTTPKLSGGCVEGIMRRYILNDLQTNGKMETKESDIDSTQIDLKEIPWFTLNSLSFKYSYQKGMEMPGELKNMIRSLEKLTD